VDREEVRNPAMPFEAAAQMEKDLTENLRAKGYTVTGERNKLSMCDMPAQQTASSNLQRIEEQEIRRS
jgi:hypothetical protein